MASQVRQNYHEESEKGVNEQINLELSAMYTYLSMVSHSSQLAVRRRILLRTHSSCAARV